MADLFAGLVRRVTEIALEVVAALGSTSAREDLMARAGQLPPAAAPPPNADLTATLTALEARAAAPGGGDDALGLLKDLGDAMTTLVAFVQQAAEVDSLDDAWNFLATYLDLIFVQRLRLHRPETLALLQVLHLISEDRVMIADAIRAGPRWGNYLLGSPADDDAAANNLSIILGALLGWVGFHIPPEDDTGNVWREDILFGWDPDPSPANPHAQRALARAATYRLTRRAGDVAASPEAQVGITAIVVPPEDGGLGVYLGLELGGDVTFAIGDHLELVLAADAPGAFDVFFGDPTFAGVSGAGASASLLLRRKAETADALELDLLSGVSLEMGTFSTGLQVGDPTHLSLAVGGGALVLSRDTLGFLGSVLPSGGTKMTFDAELTLDTKGHLTFAGGAGLRVTVPVNKTVSVYTIRSITLAMSIKEGETGAGASVAALASFVVRFGSAFIVTVDQIGAELLWRLPSSPPPEGPQPDQAPPVAGNIGPIGHLSLDFVAPTGIGVEIAIGPVTGGGFLFFDPTRRTYGGVLEASMQLCSRGIQVKAAGLLRESDDGWSFLLIVSAQFHPGFEIFVGFTLNGVGGMVGINVAVDIDKLREGLHDGSVGRLLFPDDPVANAPAIIATMAAVFPVRRGAWVAGPMLQLGWGRPDPFVTLSVAIVLSFPSPAVLAILGRLELTAPSKDAPLVMLKADFLGVISFDEPSVSFDASLVESRLAAFPLTGDIALRAGAPGFVLAVGGLHPNFTSPIPLPKLRRIALDVSADHSTKIRAEAYIAVTSNTFQIGLHASLDIDAGPASVHGWVDLDALIQRTPRFWFSVHIDIGLELRIGGRCISGINVDLLLEGPGPWHAKGSASISFVFFTLHARFETTWGEISRSTPPPTIDAVAVVVQALSTDGAWSAVAPTGAAIVSFRDVRRGAIGVHPDGQLSVRQQTVPIGVPLCRIGQSPVVGGSQIVTLAPSGGAPPSAASTGLFATSQFLDLSDDERLGRPSFESFQDGVLFGSTTMVTSAVQTTTTAYETVFVPDPAPPLPRRRLFHALTIELMAHSLERGSIARSGLHTAALHNGPSQQVRLSDESYRIVHADSLTAVAPHPLPFKSMTAAMVAMGSDPRLAVVAAHEVVS